MTQRVMRALASSAIALGVLLPCISPAALLTGADLLSMAGTGAFFPTSQPTLTGTSITFGGSGSGEKLIVVPLLAPGVLGAASPFSTSFTVNLTRLACVSAACGPATDDFDPHFLLGDGANLVGALTADNDGGSALGASLTDAGNAGSARNISAPLFTSAGYPAIGSAFDVNLAFAVGATETTVTIGYYGFAGTYSETVRALDVTRGLSFVLLRDLDGHASERYQINSLSFNSSVPAPGSAALLASGLLAFGIAWCGAGRIASRSRSQATARTVKTIWAALAVSLASTNSIAAAYSESGDAGSIPATAQTASGTGPLDTILGSLVDGLPDTDLYRIHFNAGTVGAWVQFPAASSGVSQDTRLFLFDAQGRGILGTTVQAGATFNWVLPASGDYLLAVTQGSLEPYGPKDQFGSDFPIFLSLLAGAPYLGPNGPAGSEAVANWGGTYHGASGAYIVNLVGAEFVGTIPTPATLALLGAALVVLPAARGRR